MIKAKFTLVGGKKLRATIPKLDAVIVYEHKNPETNEKGIAYFRRTGPADYQMLTVEQAERLLVWIKEHRVAPKSLNLAQVDIAINTPIPKEKEIKDGETGTKV